MEPICVTDCDGQEIFRPSALLSSIRNLNQYEFNQPEMVSGTVPLWLQSSYFIALWTWWHMMTHGRTRTYQRAICHNIIDLFWTPLLPSHWKLHTVQDDRRGALVQRSESGQMNMSRSSHARQRDNECRNVYGGFLEHMRANSSFRIVIPGSEALDIEHQV